MQLTLHGYWRSSAAYRVRIALGLKGLAYEACNYDLRTGAHCAAGYMALQPQGLVPALETDDGVLIQSLAIIEWLEERFPSSALLPSSAAGRATVRAMALLVAADVHPLNNLRVLQLLERDFAADEAAKRRWIGHWVQLGLDALEQLVAQWGRGWAYGDAPSMADCCLIPQLYVARRFAVPLEGYPRLLDVDARAARHVAFAAAHPDRQADADDP